MEDLSLLNDFADLSRNLTNASAFFYLCIRRNIMKRNVGREIDEQVSVINLQNGSSTWWRTFGGSWRLFDILVDPRFRYKRPTWWLSISNAVSLKTLANTIFAASAILVDVEQPWMRLIERIKHDNTKNLYSSLTRKVRVEIS